MTIEERLENMEREVGRVKRRNRWLLGAILVLLGGLVAPGVFKTMITPVQAQVAGMSKEIRARVIHTKGIVIEDENGKICAGLAAGEFGPHLVLFDEKGAVRARLAADTDGPGLSLYDEKGPSRAALTVGKDGPSLTLDDENGEIRAALIASKDGPGLTLYDEKGYYRAGLDLSKDGSTLLLLDENRNPRAALCVSKDGPWLSLNDEKGNARFAAGKTELESPDGKTIEYPESSLILFGPDGKVIWSAIK